MDDVEASGQVLNQVRKLHGWALSPESQGALKLVLQYEPRPDQAGGELVELLLPPEAALYLADELNRQARRTLESRAREQPDPT
jgi:hypothetical protein